MQLNENRVREYAYELWESEGRPEGRAEKHWEMACKSLENEKQHSDTFIPHQNTKKGKHAHHAQQPH
jgi:hypothetical protein